MMFFFCWGGGGLPHKNLREIKTFHKPLIMPISGVGKGVSCVRLVWRG